MTHAGRMIRAAARREAAARPPIGLAEENWALSTQSRLVLACSYVHLHCLLWSIYHIAAEDFILRSQSLTHNQSNNGVTRAPLFLLSLLLSFFPSSEHLTRPIGLLCVWLVHRDCQTLLPCDLRRSAVPIRAVKKQSQQVEE